MLRSPLRFLKIISLIVKAIKADANYFVSGNYLIAADGEIGLMISAGGRSIIKKIGLDYSHWIPVFPEMGSFIAAPFLGITVPLGKSSR
jgi:hypothetical protein